MLQSKAKQLRGKMIPVVTWDKRNVVRLNVIKTLQWVFFASKIMLIFNSILETGVRQIINLTLRKEVYVVLMKGQL